MHISVVQSGQRHFDDVQNLLMSMSQAMKHAFRNYQFLVKSVHWNRKMTQMNPNADPHYFIFLI